MRSIRARRTTSRSACSAASIGSMRARAPRRRSRRRFAAGRSPRPSPPADVNQRRGTHRAVVGHRRRDRAGRRRFRSCSSRPMDSPTGSRCRPRPARRPPSVHAAVAAAAAVADRSLCGAGARRCLRAASCATRCARSIACRSGDALAAGCRTPSCGHSTRTAGRGRRRSVIGIVHCRSRVATQRMKCPKCGYLGFETTDRCRNCQYDFSLAPFAPEPELTLHGADRKTRIAARFRAAADRAAGRRAERHRARPRSPVRRSGAGARSAADLHRSSVRRSMREPPTSAADDDATGAATKRPMPGARRR